MGSQYSNPAVASGSQLNLFVNDGQPPRRKMGRQEMEPAVMSQAEEPVKRKLGRQENTPPHLGGAESLDRRGALSVSNAALRLNIHRLMDNNASAVQVADHSWL